jgi:hypothetical protein
LEKEISMTRCIPHSRHDAYAPCSRRRALLGGAGLVAASWLGAGAGAHAQGGPAASLEAALSSRFDSLPESAPAFHDRRHRSQVARLAWSNRDYDLGWWSAVGRPSSHRAAILAEQVEGPFDLHVILPGNSPAGGNAPPLPQERALTAYAGPPQTRQPKGVVIALRKRDDAPATAEIGRMFGPALFFGIQNACRVAWGETLRMDLVEFVQHTTRQHDVCEMRREPTGLLFNGARPGSHVEIQLDLRRRHCVADVVRGA